MITFFKSNALRIFLIILGLLVFTLPAVLSAIQVYVLGGFDIAIFAQAMTSTVAESRPFVRVAEYTDHMGVHFQPILYPLGWIYGLLEDWCPAYQYLMIIQIFAFMMLFFVSYRAKTIFELWFMVSCAAFWGVFATTRFEFRPETLGVVFSLVSVLNYSRGHRYRALIHLWFSAACGELFFVSSMVLSALIISAEFKKSVKLFVIIFGFLGGVICLSFYQNHAVNIFGRSPIFNILERYPLGGSVFEIIKVALVHPTQVMALAFTPGKLIYVAALALIAAGPIASWWLLRPYANDTTSCKKGLSMITAGIFAIIPGLGKIILSNYTPYTSFDKHYAADLMPGLFFLTYGLYCLLGVKNSDAWQKVRPSTLFIYLLCVVAVSCVPVYSQLLEINQTLLYGKHANAIFPNELRQTLRSLGRDKIIFANTGGVYAELSQNINFISPFTIEHITNRLGLTPDILVLGWPPNHFADQFTTSRFDRSFRQIDDETLESNFNSNVITYKLTSHFTAKLPGDIWIWNRMQ